jgi:hypothetical protein
LDLGFVLKFKVWILRFGWGVSDEIREIFFVVPLDGPFFMGMWLKKVRSSGRFTESLLIGIR